MLHNRSITANAPGMVRITIRIIIVLLALGLLTTPGYAAPSSEGSQQGALVTPYQQAIQQLINARTGQGLSAPRMSTSLSANTFQRELRGGDGAVETTEMATATTILQFDNPQQLGLDAWPALTGGVETEDGNVIEINVDDELRAELEAQGALEDYDYDQGPRTFTTVETIQRLSTGSSVSTRALTLSNEDILMGFTMSMGFEYSVSDSVTLGYCDFPVGTCVTASFSFGFHVGLDAGLRLPASVQLEGPDVVEVGEEYTVDATLTGEDWGSADYEAVGVPAQGGNEFILGASAGWSLNVSYSGCLVFICGGDSGGFSDDYFVGFSDNYTTPLGAGASFPIDLDPIPLVGFNFLILSAGIDLEVTPQLGSDKITADWEAVPGTNCEGSGTVTFTQSGASVPIEVTACDNGNPDHEATIELTNFRYWFTIFQIDFDLVFHMSASVFDYDLFNINESILSFTLDVSDFVTGLVDPYIEDHFGCELDLNDMDLDCTTLENTATFTTTTVDTTAAETTLTPSGTLGNNNWWVSDEVYISLSADDAGDCGSGVALIEYRINDGSWTTYTGMFPMNVPDGIHTVYYRSTDNDGNVEDTQSEEIKIDRVKPTIDFYFSSPPNGAGWWNEPVTVYFVANDDTSGVFSVTPDTTFYEGAGQFIIGIAEDYAGWESDPLLVDDINVDLTPPELTIISPESLVYANVNPLLVDWEASDALSGIFSETGLLDGSDPYNDGDFINLLLVAAGEHNFSVEVVDVADNVTFNSVTFWVSVDIDGLIASVEEMCELGLISNSGICNALLAKLHNAQNKIEICQLHTAVNMLEAFINQVNAQNGMSIDGEAAGVLIADALYVINHLPDCEPVNGNQPDDNPGNGPDDNPGNGPNDNPGNGPNDNPGNGPNDNPGNGPNDNPGNGPNDNPGNGPNDNPGNGPNDNPGNVPDGNPGNGPNG